MSLFKNMLSDRESLIIDPDVLDFNYMPKLIPYREKEQKYVASCIQPLFRKQSGRNVFIYGPPGIGKTLAMKKVLEELEEQADEIIPLYINCWQANSAFKIYSEICEKLGYHMVQNRGAEEIFKELKLELNKKSAVFVFDEIDKVEDMDFIYSILEEIFIKAIIIVTNYKGCLSRMEERIRSRLTLNSLEFKPYNPAETKGILKQRVEYALAPNVLDEKAFSLTVEKTIERGDIRIGLNLLKEAAGYAENRSSRKILVEDANKAISLLEENKDVNSPASGDEDINKILEIVRLSGPIRLADLVGKYQENGGMSAYRTVFRKVSILSQKNMLSLKKIVGGADGKTTIVSIPKTP